MDAKTKLCCVGYLILFVIVLCSSKQLTACQMDTCAYASSIKTTTVAYIEGIEIILKQVIDQL